MSNLWKMSEYKYIYNLKLILKKLKSSFFSGSYLKLKGYISFQLIFFATDFHGGNTKNYE